MDTLKKRSIRLDKKLSKRNIFSCVQKTDSQSHQAS